jgi:hypothetical protein
MNKGKLMTIGITAILVVMFYDKIVMLPLVNKIPRF